MRHIVLTALVLSFAPAFAETSFDNTSRALKALWPSSTPVQRQQLARSGGGRPMSKVEASNAVIVESAVGAARMLKGAMGRPARSEEIEIFLEHLTRGLNQTNLVVPTRAERVEASRNITSSIGLAVAFASLGNVLYATAMMQWGLVPMEVARANLAISKRNLLLAAVPIVVLGVHHAHRAFLNSRSDDRYFFPGSEALARYLKTRRARRLFYESFAAELERESDLEMPRDPRQLFAIAKTVWSPEDFARACSPLLDTARMRSELMY